MKRFALRALPWRPVIRLASFVSNAGARFAWKRNILIVTALSLSACSLSRFGAQPEPISPRRIASADAPDRVCNRSSGAWLGDAVGSVFALTLGYRGSDPDASMEPETATAITLGGLVWAWSASVGFRAVTQCDEAKAAWGRLP